MSSGMLEILEDGSHLASILAGSIEHLPFLTHFGEEPLNVTLSRDLEFFLLFSRQVMRETDGPYLLQKIGLHRRSCLVCSTEVTEIPLIELLVGRENGVGPDDRLGLFLFAFVLRGSPLSRSRSHRGAARQK